MCSVAGTVFSGDFHFLQPAPQQCHDWDVFRSQLTATGDTAYSAVVMSGSNQPGGVTCHEPTVATQICQALHAPPDPAQQPLSCDGHFWNVGQCNVNDVLVTELVVDNALCVCTFDPSVGHSVRPCILNGNWGGVNTATCGAQDQSMTVVCVLSPPSP